MAQEAKIEKRLKKRIEEDLNGLCLKILCNHFSGFPDRMCLLPKGRLIFVELKAPGEKPSKLQLLIHRKLSNLGFNILVIDSKEKVDALC